MAGVARTAARGAAAVRAKAAANKAALVAVQVPATAATPIPATPIQAKGVATTADTSTTTATPEKAEIREPGLYSSLRPARMQPAVRPNASRI